MRKRGPFPVNPTTGGEQTNIIPVFGEPEGATGAANNDATSRSRTPPVTTIPSVGQVRVRFEAAANAALAVDNSSVGIWDGVAGKADTLLTPIELKFAGASGFSLSAGAIITSDWAIVAGVTIGSSLVVISDYSSANGNAVPHAGQASPAASYLKAATNSFNTTVTPAASTENIGNVYDVIEIDVQ